MLEILFQRVKILHYQTFIQLLLSKNKGKNRDSDKGKDKPKTETLHKAEERHNKWLKVEDRR